MAEAAPIGELGEVHGDDGDAAGRQDLIEAIGRREQKSQPAIAGAISMGVALSAERGIRPSPPLSSLAMAKSLGSKRPAR